MNIERRYCNDEGYWNANSLPNIRTLAPAYINKIKNQVLTNFEWCSFGVLGLLNLSKLTLRIRVYICSLMRVEYVNCQIRATFRSYFSLFRCPIWLASRCHLPNQTNTYAGAFLYDTEGRWLPAGSSTLEPSQPRSEEASRRSEPSPYLLDLGLRWFTRAAFVCWYMSQWIPLF